MAGELNSFDHLVVLLLLLTPVVMGKWLWPRMLSSLGSFLPSARLDQYRTTILAEWLLVLAVVAQRQRSLRALRFLGLWTLEWVPLAIGLGIAALVLTLLWFRLKWTVASDARLVEHSGKLGARDPALPRTVRERQLYWATAGSQGICEEFLYRGFLMWYLTNWFGHAMTGIAIAVIVSSLLYGLVHIHLGLAFAIRAGLAGAFLAVLSVGTGTIYPAMILHGAFRLEQGERAYLALRYVDLNL